ncbi:hypothetical protein [Kineosporia succinea]|uniref:Ricin-type beta-trefoil lectin protein n=1 Tax=Kineosporia succinea TaxID=84632 RepID=A0ABT9NZB3_9ACTN|nr:hypothetical protein [Kineosporia succinea]MDP9825762.1 hypothetical protein [Kineosporia succinea]
MFSARISHRAKTVTAIAGVPAVAAGLWLTTAGTAQAAEKPSSAAVSAAAAKPLAGEPVLIKGSKYKGKDRIVTVRGTGKVDLSRSKPTASNGLSADGTSMVLKKVGGRTSTKYTIMSMNDSEEINAYCLQQKKNGTLNIVVCDSAKTNQQFNFKAKGTSFSVTGKWGALRADKRQLRTVKSGESASNFKVVAR